MFKNKKICSMLAALVMAGGFGYGAVTPSFAEASIEEDMRNDYRIEDEVLKMPFLGPQNITKMTIAEGNKQYLKPNFPELNIGEDRTIKTEASKVEIKCREAGILLTETVSRKNPKFTYIKELPNGLTKEDVEGSKDDTDSKIVEMGVTYKGIYGIYEVPIGVHAAVVYKGADEAQVILFIPNEVYWYEFVEINNDSRLDKILSLAKSIWGTEYYFWKSRETDELTVIPLMEKFYDETGVL